VQPPVTRSFDCIKGYVGALMAGLRAEYWSSKYHDIDFWLSKWPEAKRRALEKSIADGDSYCPWKCLADVKRECLSSCPTKARLIQYYFNLRTQAAFGGQFYALQKTMTSKLRFHTMGTTDVTFGSGMNAREIGEWMDAVVARGAQCFYERDGKCWDATMSTEHAALRVWAYSLVDPALASFAASCVEVWVTHKDYLTRRNVMRYHLESTVKSGHNDTTLGNSLINALITVAVFDSMKIRASIMVAGDDLIVAVYQDFDFAAVVAAEAEYGIKPEARKFACPEDVSFISGIFVRLGRNYSFLPKPGRLIAKLWWTVNPPARRRLAAYQRGVALGLWPSCSGVPIVRSLLRPYVDLPVAPIYNPRGYKYHGCYTPPHPDFEQWFNRRYHTCTAEVQRVERLILAQNGAVCYVSHPLLEEMCRVDLGDICDREAAYVARA